MNCAKGNSDQFRFHRVPALLIKKLRTYIRRRFFCLPPSGLELEIDQLYRGFILALPWLGYDDFPLLFANQFQYPIGYDFGRRLDFRKIGFAEGRDNVIHNCHAIGWLADTNF